jgi:flagellin
MSLGINNNITALNAWRQLKGTDRNLSSSMEKLSSGMRINRASDDPAGLVISEKMRAQLVGLNAAVKNSEKAVNMVSTAEAALDKVMSMLDKMRELAIDAANLGVNDQAMLTANQGELDELVESVTRIAGFTQFGTLKLLDGTLFGDTTAVTYTTGHSAVFQVGPNENQIVEVDIPSTKAYDLSVLSAGATLDYQASSGSDIKLDATTVGTLLGVDIATERVSLELLHSRPGDPTSPFTKGIFLNTNLVDAGTPVAGSPNLISAATTVASLSQGIGVAIAMIDKAIEDVANIRGKLGAVQADNLQVQLDSLLVAYENLQASESTIRDVDMTREMATFTKYQIMMQAGTAMLSQANQIPSTLLSLLK